MFQPPQRRTARELLKNPKLAIPIYQRGYAWTDEQVVDFIDDILDLWKANPAAGEQHFLGMMLCYSKSDQHWGTVLEIIDGQQRLTTTSVLLLAFRKAIESVLALPDIHPATISNGKELCEQIDQLLIVHYEQERTTKLALNETDQAEWKRLVFGGDTSPPAERRRAPASVQNLNNAFDAIYTQLLAKLANPDPPAPAEAVIAEIRLRLNQALDKLNVVLLTAENEKSVYDLFTIINDRGKPLSPLDLLRTGTLSRLKARHSLFEKANRCFAPLLLVDEAEAQRAMVHFINSHTGSRVPNLTYS